MDEFSAWRELIEGDYPWEVKEKLLSVLEGNDAKTIQTSVSLK